MEIEIIHAKSGKSLGKLQDLQQNSTILDVKNAFIGLKPNLYPERQSFRTEPKGKAVKDEKSLKEIGVTNGGRLFFKDLGPQIGWTTVFLCEYAGPLVAYLLFYPRPSIIYGAAAAAEPRAFAVQVACFCWIGHYAKRLLETLFVHRFSNATMPVTNIFKNCGYYWGFAAFVSYFVNHPLYSPPMYGDLQLYAGLVGFAFCELGNLSIHLALRDLRPAGSKERRIPYPTPNPLTALFGLVSCPNYTYEFGSWLSFAVLTQSLPALLFTAAGIYQMSMWAIGKHRNYRREFKDYPRGRKAIIPFLM